MAPRASIPSLSASITPSRRRAHWASESRPAGRSGWMPCAEERLVGVDVADTGDAALVKQKGLHRRGTPARERAQVLGGEALVQRLQPQPRGEEELHRLLSQQQLAGAEAARIDNHQAPAPWAARPRGCGWQTSSQPRCSGRWA